MRILGSTLLLLAALGLATGAAAQADKADGNAKKLVGVWELVKSAEAPPGATVEFSRDGKMKVSFELKGKAVNIAGTYKVEGDKIRTVQEFGGRKNGETLTIQTLNDTTLIWRDARGKVDEFKRKK